MKKKYNAQETIRKILDVSLHLMINKGYNNTSMQDIIDGVGLSKGAIYYHFKSKEEIFLKIEEQLCNHDNLLETLKEFPDKNALEKIQMILFEQISHQSSFNFKKIEYQALRDPRFFMMAMQENMSSGAEILATLIQEGIDDGSIKNKNIEPFYSAQLILLLMNFWLFSPLPDFSLKDFDKKIAFLKKILDHFGLCIIDDSIEAQFLDYFNFLSAPTK